MTDPINEAPGAPAASHDSLAAAGEAPPTALFAARRAQLGLSLEDVANQLKFSPRLIEALEAGEFDKLPGGTFARGMMRSYARLLKLDPAAALAQMSAAGIGPQPGPEQAVSLRAPIPFSEGGKHVNFIYTAISVIILVVVAFFAFEWYQEKSRPPKLAFVSAGQDSAQPPAALPLAPEPSPAEPRSAVPVPVGRDANASTFASAGPAPVRETAVRGLEKQPAEGAAGPLAPGKRRIVMRFEKDSWVEIKARNGVTLMSQLNPAGSEKVVDGDPPFQLTIGNAPSVHVSYNDQPVDLKPHFKVDVARFTLN